MSNRPKIAVLGSYAPSLVNFRGPLIRELVSRGYQVEAMAPDISPELALRLSAMGAAPRQVELARNPLDPGQMLGALRSLTKLFRETKPAVVIPYTIQPATIGVVAAARAGVPKIVPLIEGLGYPFGTGTTLKRRISRLGAIALYRWALPKSSTVVFLNPDDRPDLERAGAFPPGHPHGVINGIGVDLDEFEQAQLPAAPSFLMATRLIRDKGVFEFAEASAKLKKQYPNVDFALAGWIDSSADAISAPDLQRLVKSGVRYLGKLDDIRPALANASVFVLPSGYREGVPRSIMEAMAMGRAIITCDTPGCRETVIEGQNGFLIPPFSADDLHGAMQRFIRDPFLATAMGIRSRQLAEERYDVKAVNAAFLQIAGL